MAGSEGDIMSAADESRWNRAVELMRTFELLEKELARGRATIGAAMRKSRDESCPPSAHLARVFELGVSRARFAAAVREVDLAFEALDRE